MTQKEKVAGWVEARAEVVEDVLDCLGLPWKRREGGWVIPAAAGRPREIVLATTETGLCVVAELCAWDELEEISRWALTWMLERASRNIRYAQCEVRPSRAVAVAVVSENLFEAELRTAIGGVLVASRAPAREAGALLDVELATHLVEFFEKSERILTPERI